MKRLLAIPAAGTVAALIVVLLAHEPRAEEPGPVFPEPPPFLPDEDLSRRSPEGAKADAPKPEEKPEKKPAPKPPPVEHFLQLEKDGSLIDPGSTRTFADGAAVIAELVRPDVRDRILLSNGKGVDDAALDKLVESLSAKFQVRKVYRAPEKEE